MQLSLRNELSGLDAKTLCAMTIDDFNNYERKFELVQGVIGHFINCIKKEMDNTRCQRMEVEKLIRAIK